MLNRLLAADFSTWDGAGWTATLAYDLAGMQYDKAGNITALQRDGPAGTLLDNLTYAYTAGTNRLAAVTDLVGGTGETWDAEIGGFTYDANGNMVTGPAPYGMSAVTYDPRNLPLVLTANGVTSAYRYDEQGQRISKQVGGGNTEYYVLDGRTSLAVVTVHGVGSAVTWTWNVLAGDKVVGRETSTAQRFYYHTDLLGSTRVVVQGATVVEAYDYDPWGVRLDGRTVAGATREGFTTKERDAESGLDYFGARYYMAALGRWTSVDPLVDSFPAWNGYNYVKGNPVRTVDPDGRCPDGCILEGGVAVAAVGVGLLIATKAVIDGIDPGQALTKGVEGTKQVVGAAIATVKVEIQTKVASVRSILRGLKEAAGRLVGIPTGDQVPEVPKEIPRDPPGIINPAGPGKSPVTIDPDGTPRIEFPVKDV